LTPAKSSKEFCNNFFPRAIMSCSACRWFFMIARCSSASAILSSNRILLPFSVASIRFLVASLGFFIAKFAASLVTSNSFFGTR